MASGHQHTRTHGEHARTNRPPHGAKGLMAAYEEAPKTMQEAQFRKRGASWGFQGGYRSCQ